MSTTSRPANSKFGALRGIWVLALLLCAVAVPAQRNGTAESGWEARDQWQRPAEVMDALHLQTGSKVADIGAGNGYFTVRLAERAGGEGKVYAVDVDSSVLSQLRDEAKKRNLPQVEVVHGATDDPHLPASSLDAVLIVNAYHEFRQHDAMLQAIRRALKPGGLLGIIDKDAAAGESRSAYESKHRLPESFVRGDLESNGFIGIQDQRGFEPADEHKSETWWFVVASKAK